MTRVRHAAPLVGGVGAVVALVVLGVAWFGTGVPDPADLTPLPSASETTAPAATGIVVHVSGEVGRPGLVTVANGARVADVIAAAGGALRTADLDVLNLAAEVRDAEHVHVPSVAAAGQTGGGGGFDADGVDLNQATADELEQLPGVGPVLAARIIAHREEYGPFTTIEDLLDVPGIGEAKLALLRSSVRSP